MRMKMTARRASAREMTKKRGLGSGVVGCLGAMVCRIALALTTTDAMPNRANAAT